MDRLVRTLQYAYQSQEQFYQDGFPSVLHLSTTLLDPISLSQPVCCILRLRTVPMVSYPISAEHALS